MKRPYFDGLITEAQKESLETLATDKGLQPEELLRRIIDDGIEKLEHLARCKPRGRKAPGRPFEGSEGARVGELAKTLRNIYGKLREQHGKDFDELFGKQEVDLQSALEAKDINALEGILESKPWLLRKW